MNHDLNKSLERARRSLEKNKLREAVSAFQEVLSEDPAHPEALQALADIYTRLNEPALAAQYYGHQFDRYAQSGDAAKASAIFTRFLRAFPQPPARLMQYATLLQKQNKTPEAIENFGTAAELFRMHGSDIEALACHESIALLDSENAARHAELAELAEQLHHANLAARSYLRAGQLTLASGSLEPALDYLGRAHNLLPEDRSVSMAFAETRLRKGDGQGAVDLLEPFWPAERDAGFLTLFGESLLLAGHLDRAREVVEAQYKENPDTYEKLFELAAAYLRAGEEEKAVSVVVQATEWMREKHRETELSSEMDLLAQSFPASLPLAETIAHTYEELNRETKYFEALIHVFDLCLAAGQIKQACEALDRLVDIDPYDSRNLERIAALEGKAEPEFLQNILARTAKAATSTARAGGFSEAALAEEGGPAFAPDAASPTNALEDLIVQAEIFLQYSLQPKAIERLERIAQLFPGEEATNERLRSLCERANWWPQGAPPAPQAAPSHAAPEKPAPAAPPTVAAPTPAETHRDLAAIAEMNRLMYRQITPREVIAAMAAEIGKHLKATRCLAVVGAAGESPQFTAEYFAAGVPGLGAERIPSIVPLISKAAPDELGGIALEASGEPALGELGFDSALAVALVDKETQAPWGAVLVGDSAARKWKPRESFFLQAAGDQLVLAVNHTRLRPTVRSIAVADEKTGLVSRGAYLDCLLMEAARAREQSTPVSLAILQIDHGGELLRQHGDAVESYVEKLSRALSSTTSHADIAVKYTAWSLVFILPGSSLEKASSLAEKMREVAAAVPHPWDGENVTLSAVVAEATSRPGDNAEDRVTEWINRAEAGLDEVRQRGGNTLLPLATP